MYTFCVLHIYKVLGEILKDARAPHSGVDQPYLAPFHKPQSLAELPCVAQLPRPLGTRSRQKELCFLGGWGRAGHEELEDFW